MMTDTDHVREDQCWLCSGIWPSERDAFRDNLDKIPFDDPDKPVCNRCFMAFCRNIGFPVRDDDNGAVEFRASEGACYR